MASPVSPLTESHESLSSSETNENSVSFSSDIGSKVFMGQQPALKNWKMYGDTPQDDASSEALDAAAIKEDKSDVDGIDFNSRPTRGYSDRYFKSGRPVAPFWLQVSQSVAVFLTVAWFTYAAIYIMALPGSIKTIMSSPLTLGGILASVLAPIAMLWLCIATWQRRSDAHIYAKALREELRGLFYPTANQEEHISEDIRNLMKQATEMSASSRGAIKAIQRARTGLRSEIRDFAGISQKAEIHIDRLADALAKRAEELLSLTETIELQTENISTKAQRGVTAWENVSSEITELGDEISEIFQAGTAKLTVASDTTLAKVESIQSALTSSLDGIMDIGTTKLVDASAATLAKIDGVEDRLTQAIESIFSAGSSKLLSASDETTAQISAVETNLSTVVDSLAEKLAGLVMQVDGTQANLDGQVERLESISESLSSGTSRLETSLDGAGKISDAVENVMGVMTASLGRVEETAESLFARTETIEQKLDERAEVLNASAERLLSSTETIQTVGDLATNKLSEALSMAISGADTISSTVRRAKDMMDKSVMEASDQIIATSKLADEKLEALMSEARTNRDYLTTLIAEIESKQALFSNSAKDIDSSSGKIIDAADKATTALTAAMNNMIAKTTEPMNLITATVESLDAKAHELDDKLSVRVVEMGQQTGKLKSLVDDISTNLADELTNIAMTSEKVAGYSRTIGDGLTTQRDNLTAIVRELQTKTEIVSGLLEDQSSHMNSSLADAESKISYLGQTYFDRSDEVLNRANQIAERMSGFESHINETLLTITAKSATIGDTVDEQIRHFTRLNENISPEATHILLEAERIANRYDDLRQNYVATTETAAACLIEMGDKLDARLGKIGDETTQTSKVFLTATEGLASAMTSIRRASEEAHEKMNLIQTGVKGKIDDLQIVTDQVRVKFETLQDNLGGHISNLDSSVHKVVDHLEDASAKFDATSSLLDNKAASVTSKIISRLEEASVKFGETASLLDDNAAAVTSKIISRLDGASVKFGETASLLDDNAAAVTSKIISRLEEASTKFGTTTSLLDNKASAVASKILESTNQYIEEGHRMSLLGEQAAHKSSRMVGVIQEETARLVNSATESLGELQKSGDSLSVRAKEIEGYLLASINHARSYSSELKEQAGMVAGQSAEVVERIAEATLKLTARVTEVKQAGAGVASEIEASRVRLADESLKLGNVARKTVDAADEAALVFGKHSESLQRTVDDMIEQARKVREEQIRTERDSFLSSAKFVIESLYSLAIDVARHLEGDLDMRVLRAYQRGDVSAYAKHLVDIVPKIPAERSQRKFIEDGEFRTYVLRFIRQYEELLEQAQGNDYADLLSSVFSSSDVGKLYKMLCEFAGRNAKEH